MSDDLKNLLTGAQYNQHSSGMNFPGRSMQHREHHARGDSVGNSLHQMMMAQAGSHLRQRHADGDKCTVPGCGVPKGQAHNANAHLANMNQKQKFLAAAKNKNVTGESGDDGKIQVFGQKKQANKYVEGPGTDLEEKKFLSTNTPKKPAQSQANQEAQGISTGPEIKSPKKPAQSHADYQAQGGGPGPKEEKILNVKSPQKPAQSQANQEAQGISTGPEIKSPKKPAQSHADYQAQGGGPGPKEEKILNVKSPQKPAQSHADYQVPAIGISNKKKPEPMPGGLDAQGKRDWRKKNYNK